MATGNGGFSFTTTSTTTSSSVVTQWVSWINVLDTSTSASAWTSWTIRDTYDFGEREIEQTTEQLAALEAERERKAAEKLVRERRALDLLMLALDEQQRRDLADRGCFYLEVIPRDGSIRRYEIRRGRAGNVYQVDSEGKRIAKFCAHPAEFCPDPDTMLAQKLMIEADEEAFLALANRSACA